jgi:putative Holliday junction resolvase
VTVQGRRPAPDSQARRVTIALGVRIGVDVGSVRVGVAASDPRASMAFPVTTVQRKKDDSDLDELAALIAEREAVEVVVGLPRTLAGGEGPAVAAARSYAAALSERIAPVPVTFVDERLTTVVADRALKAARPRSSVRERRAAIDAAAAAGILQTYLDGLARRDAHE